MGFFGSVFGGKNPTLNQNIGNFGTIGGFSQAQGMGDTGAASAFWKTLLSGNNHDIAKLLSPQISTIQKQGNEQLKTTSEFGNRSGGTNAGNQQNMDKSRAAITDMIAKLTGQAAGSLGDMGTNLLNIGLNAYGMQDQASQERMQNWMNSILGKGIRGGAAAGEGFLLGGTGGAQQGFSSVFG